MSVLSNIIYPPLPPSSQEESIKSFIPGKFEYIKQDSTREMLINAWQAITLTEKWNFMKEAIFSYQLSDVPERQAISKKMEELGYYGHSGCSFGWTMRQMQFIAQHGEEAYKKQIIEQ